MENENLPVLAAEQNRQFNEIKEMINKLGQLPGPTTDNPNDNPLYIDYRKIDAFMTLQSAYYNIFAQQKISLEYVPYSIISKSIKWAEKHYKKDLRKQVNIKYKKLIKLEKRNKRKLAFKKMFSSLSVAIAKPFKLIIKGFKSLFKRKKKKSDCIIQSDEPSPAATSDAVVDENIPK